MYLMCLYISLLYSYQKFAGCMRKPKLTVLSVPARSENLSLNIAHCSKATQRYGCRRSFRL